MKEPSTKGNAMRKARRELKPRNTRNTRKGAGGGKTLVQLTGAEVQVIRLALAGYAREVDRMHTEAWRQAIAEGIIERSEKW